MFVLVFFGLLCGQGSRGVFICCCWLLFGQDSREGVFICCCCVRWAGQQRMNVYLLLLFCYVGGVAEKAYLPVVVVVC